jgi:hypothetical protein
MVPPPSYYSPSPPCFLAALQAQQYRDQLYRQAPGWCLDWRHRLPLLLHEVQAWRPQVLCLQEVDQFSDLEAGLRNLG